MANETGTTHEDVAKLKEAVKITYLKRKNAIYGLCLQYAGMALKRFRQKQAHNAFWQNQTGNLFNNAFSDAEVTKEFISFFLSLKEDYGRWVELANDRKHEAVRPTVMAFYSRFMRDAEKIFDN